MARRKPNRSEPRQKSIANRTIKSSLFEWVLSSIAVVIEISNAFLGTRYGPETKAALATLKKALGSGHLNDLSFFLDDNLVVLVEHQSTLSDNIVYRMLQYIAETYRRYLTYRVEFNKQKITLKRPKFIVLYNGKEDMPDKMTLRLSDLFADCGEYGPPAGDGTPDLELTVTVYNINKGHNEEKIKACPTLHQYCIFMDTLREYEEAIGFDAAVVKTVEECIEKDVLKEFLLQNRGEVINMLTSEWSINRALEVEREEAWEGGKAEEREKNARAMMARGMDADTISEVTGMTVDDVLRL